MSTQIQRRKGTTAEHSTFTGVEGELTVDTTKDTVVVHDGATTGGRPLLREDGTNSALALGSAATPSLKFAGDTNTGIYSPGADQLAISTNGTGRLFVGSTGAVTIQNDNFLTWGNNAQGFSGHDSSSNLRFYTSFAERMRLDSSGRLGIGTTSPLYNLESASATDTQLSLTRNAVGRWLLGVTSTNSLTFGKEGASEAARIDSSGRLGLGTSTANGLLHIGTANTRAILLNNSTIGTASTDGTYLSNSNDGSFSIVNQETSSTFQLRETGDTLFTTSGSERLRITSDAYVRLASGTGGIQFNGDTAAANALDDYEEGTWTVTFYDAASGGNASGTTATGYYTKVGDRISLNFAVANIDTTGMTSGNVIYFSLPFTANASKSAHFGAVFIENINTNDAAVNVVVYINASAARGFLLSSQDNLGGTAITVGNLISGAADIWGSAVYC